MFPVGDITAFLERSKKLIQAVFLGQIALFIKGNCLMFWMVKNNKIVMIDNFF